MDEKGMAGEGMVAKKKEGGEKTSELPFKNSGYASEIPYWIVFVLLQFHGVTSLYETLNGSVNATVSTVVKMKSVVVRFSD